MPGRLVQINTSRGGMPKTAIAQAMVTAAGVGDDWQTNRKYHGGPDRAVCLFGVEQYDRLRREHSIDLQPGSVGENFTTSGLDLDAMFVGDRLQVGAVLIEITDVRTPCRSLHQWHPKLMRAITGHSGWVCRVITEGTVRAGDPIELRNV